jgi:predicted nucleotidyltransferase component of viral defense system
MFSVEESERLLLMRAIAEEISAREPMAVLKGGTALLFAYGLDRFSEDLDFDLPRDYRTDLSGHITKAAQSLGFDDCSVLIKKDTETTKRYMLHYGDVRDNDFNHAYPLKIECSLRNPVINAEDCHHVGGIRVYSLTRLAEMKVSAFVARTAGRDIYDVMFLTGKYPQLVNEKTWDLIEKHVNNDIGIESLCASFEKESITDKTLKKLDAVSVVLKLKENLENRSKCQRENNAPTLCLSENQELP